ncbi:hypothetical protein AC578_7519 [Pseudocercospora eumusae]|uniref:AAA+ ATPase domain-containing protein n=1 Tax=Pseudocercospora eumusae TaxID=321146 RepID=A0A139GWK0_9PEZI|nr:hypothetical protein AC578_7519 [Pseudocercospora eumusae]
MGEYNAENTRHDSAYQGYISSYSVNSKYPELEVYDALRRIHGDYHITTVAARSADLIGFAEAGHAKAKLVRDGDSFFSVRSYAPPATRLEGGDGTIGEKVRFGLFKYYFEGEWLDVYQADWYPYEGASERIRYCFVLTPKSSLGEGEVHSPVADRLITAAGKWSSVLHEEVYVFDAGSWTKSKTLWSAVQSSSWDDVILDPAMKATLIKDVEGFFDSRETYAEYGVSWKRGIIMHGTPGCGKTISIKALMNSLQSRNVASLYVKSFKACQGEQYSIRTIFQQARIMAPCMLIFEDLDSLVVDKVRSYFLNEVDGLENNDGILMIGSTNHLERLDAGISKRPSRFDRKYHYRLPAEKERLLYSAYWKKKLAKNDRIDFHDDIPAVISKLTEGFSFAYMKELFVQTLLTIVSGRADIEDEDDDYDHVAEAEKEAQPFEAGIDNKDAKDQADDAGSVNESADDKRPKKKQKDKAKKPKRPLPEIVVPSHLQTNIFLKVLQRQAKLLWREMDNSEDDEVHGRQKAAGPSNPEYDAFMSRINAGNNMADDDEESDCNC